MLAARIDTQAAAPAARRTKHKEAAKASGGGADAIGDFLKSRTGRTVEREVVRGVFGLLKKSL